MTASVPAAASLVKSRMARTIRAIDGRVRHVETLLAAKPLREEIKSISAGLTSLSDRVGANADNAAASIAGLAARVPTLVGLIDVLAARVTALEEAAAKKITKKKAPAAVPATGTPEETPNNC